MGRERITGGALLVLAVNSVYLAARADATLFYFANVVLHVGLGVAVAAALGVLTRRLWPRLDMFWRVAAGLFATGTALGLVLTVTGATRP